MFRSSSLCFPDGGKSCFACCPPIRDPEADALNQLDRKKELFRRNRLDLNKNLNQAGEIYGDSCWGLGFLDDGEHQVGCLLHPYQNGGTDLRSLTGYQSKCAGTLCLEAVTFSRLNPVQQRFYLTLADNLDSFHYSSRRHNPLMKILPWGTMVLAKIFDQQKGKLGTRENFAACYGFFWQHLDYRLDGWLINEYLKRRSIADLAADHQAYRCLRQRLLQQYRPENSTPTPHATSEPVHRLAIPLELSRLLKFGFDLWQGTAAEVSRLQAILLAEIDRFATRK
ncbi:MAG: hypothetical protein JXO49_04355 [Deltaproteobacteria bacterium]|nr:hypothetical protein [Candidatus Anaeroferrophillus wilburensis]MBN2888561.1 hypothetical protein [Deltaproteobacteria bacterium]